MAWRPYERLIGGELEFKDGMAKGYAYFLTLGLVKFCLKQSYITSGKVKFEKSFEQVQEDMKSLIGKEPAPEKRDGYMDGFNRAQKGELGDFATGKDDNKYADYFYFEWYSEHNGRVVYEGISEEVQILEPLVFNFPSDHRSNQQDHMNNFPTNMCVSVTKETGKPMAGIQVPISKQQ